MVGVRLKHFFGTYLNRQSSLVLEVQPFLFVFNLGTFGASLALFWSFRAIILALWGYFWGQVLIQKHFWNLPIKTINFVL